MIDSSVDWIPALAVLAVGLVLGTALVWRVFAASRAAGRAAGTPAEIRDLAGKRDALLRQLRELEDTASKRTKEQLAYERYDLELRAARVVLALQDRGLAVERPNPSGAAEMAAPGALPGPASAPATERASFRGFLWGTLSTTAVLLLAFFVYQSAKPREAGGSLTGNVPMGGGGQGGRAPSRASGEKAGASEAEEAELKAALARDPSDLDAHLGLARVYLGRQDMMGVWNETKVVLERAPGNPPALAYQALVRLAMGQSQVAVDLLKKALAADPNLLDGYVHLALVYVRMGRAKDAEATVAEAKKRFPDQAAGLDQFLAELQQRETRVADAGSGDADPHAGLPAANGGAGGRRVTGTVDLDPSLKGGVPPGAVLFVFVRESGFGAGPPIAAKRFSPASFPLPFEIGEADAMTGQAFPDSLLVEARLDADGDPTTRPPTDPRARLDDVKAGATGVLLILKKP
jgi:cytochrome c-type biogenesis protein CcmH